MNGQEKTLMLRRPKFWPGGIFWRQLWQRDSAALPWQLLARDGLLQAAPVSGEAADLPPHHPPKAKRAIQIFSFRRTQPGRLVRLQAGAGKYHGQPLPSTEKLDVFFWPGGTVAPEPLGFQATRQERPVDLGVVSASGRMRRSTDPSSLRCGQHRQSHAGDFSSPIRAFG